MDYINNMNEINNKKEKMIIFVVTLILISILFSILIIKAKSNSKETIKLQKEYFEVMENSSIKLNGKSIIASEQKVIFDKSLGSLYKKYIENKKKVTKGQILFTYIDNSIQSEIERIERSITQKNAFVQKKEEKREKIINKINKCKDNNEKEILYSELKTQEDTIWEMKQEFDEYYFQIDSLKKKLFIDIKSDIDGMVYIKNQGLNDSTITYMTIISDKPLVKCEVNEFDLSSLSLGNPIQLKVLSTEEEVSAVIKSIEEIPCSNTDDLNIYSTYNVYITPKTNIKIGLSVQVKVNDELIKIPEKCVYESEGKLFVKRNVNDKLEKVAINAVLNDGEYTIQDNSIEVGDKLLINIEEADGEKND